MKKELKKLIIAIAGIVFCASILISSKNDDFITRRVAIIVFGSILLVLTTAIALEIAAEIEKYRLRRLMVKSRSGVRRYYETNPDTFQYIAQRAYNDNRLKGIIEEVNQNGKDYIVEVCLYEECGYI